MASATDGSCGANGQVRGYRETCIARADFEQHKNAAAKFEKILTAGMMPRLALSAGQGCHRGEPRLLIDVHSTFSRLIFHAFIAYIGHINVMQKILPGTQQDGRMARCSSSIKAARIYCRNGGYAAAEPTLRPPAAAAAGRRSVDASGTNEISAPPAMVSGARG